jgi:hypothetical protein
MTYRTVKNDREHGFKLSDGTSEVTLAMGSYVFASSHQATNQLSQEPSRIGGRIQRVIEYAKLKCRKGRQQHPRQESQIDSAGSHGGEESCELLMQLAVGHLRAKIPQLQEL